MMLLMMISLDIISKIFDKHMSLLFQLIFNILNSFCCYDAQTFWTAAGAIATSLAVYTALVPIIEKNRLGKALFENAVQIDIPPDGVFRIFNIFEEPIIITKISQALVKGTDIDLTHSSKPNEINKKISNFSSQNIHLVPHKLRRVIAPKLSCTYAGSLTHLPTGYEVEPLWMVRTIIEYESTSGIKRLCKFEHRFSVHLEPKTRWVEIL